MRRGFKEASKRLALEVRTELGLNGHELLDPWALAELYGIPIAPLDELAKWGCSPEAFAHFTEGQQAAFSAALVPLGPRRLIIENSAHAMTRRRVSIAHEMAHIILEHEFSSTLLTLDGCRAGNKIAEAEADQLGGELLIPYKTALAAARATWTDDQVALHFMVSRQFAAMRMNASGARKVAARQQGAYQRMVSS